VTPLSKL